MGQGLLLSTTAHSTILTFGVISTPEVDEEASILNTSPRDLVAMCQRNDTFAMLIFTEVAQSLDRVYAYYQPFTKQVILDSQDIRPLVEIEG